MKKTILPIFFILMFLVVGKGTYGQEVGDQPYYFFEGLEPPQTAVSSASAKGGAQTFYTHPEFTNIMTTTVTVPANNTGEGYIFVSASSQFYDGPSAVMILDNEGEFIYIQPMPNEAAVNNFRKQTVNGTDFLSYNAGYLPGGYSYGSEFILDESYQLVDTWTIDNGYGSDLHEFLLLENGHAILMAYVHIPYDLSPYGGPANGTIIDIVLQEQDAGKNVVFEWHASQHLPLTDTELDLTEPGSVDWLHTNAIEVDDDGNWLLSHRHFSEITKINRQTGDIIWRMGGAGNEFAFTNDIGFSRQHNILRLENGNISLFDNGNAHNPPHSRVVEYDIDEINKTVTRVWQYPGDTSQYSPSMSNGQRLPNGNTMIGWGPQGKFTEVHPAGSIALEVQMGAFSYRTYRFPWNGIPIEQPRAVLHDGVDPTAATIYTSWNGATDITGYDVYAGPTLAAMAVIDTISRDGFETEISLNSLPANTCFFQIKPIHADANPTPFSNKLFRLDNPVCFDQLEHIYFPILLK